MTMKKMMAFLGLGVVLALVLVWAVVLYTGHRTLQSELKTLRDSGEPMTPADIAAMYPAPDPSDEPHAGELYTRAFQRLQHEDAPLTEGLPYFHRDVSPPPRGEVWPEPLLDRIENHLDHHAEIRRLLRRAASRGPAHFPVEFSDGFEAQLPHLTWFRNLLRLMRIEIVWHAHQGHTDEASAVLVDLWAVADALRNEPQLISHLVRTAKLELASGSTEWLLRHQDLSQPDLMRLQTVAASTLDEGRGLRRALDAERAMGHTYFEQLRGRTASGDIVPLTAPVVLLRAGGIFPRDHAYYLRAMREGITRADQRHPDAIDRHRTETPFYAIISDILIPSFEATLRSDLIRDAQIYATVVGLAAARYQLQHEEYPETLEALVPDYLDAVPDDPFDPGAPLRYRRTETGAIVYSLGPNRTDHGGRELDDDRRPGLGHRHSDTDITFTLGDAQRELWPERWPQPPEAPKPPEPPEPNENR